MMERFFYQEAFRFVLDFPTGSEIFDRDDKFSKEEINLDVRKKDFIDNDTVESVDGKADNGNDNGKDLEIVKNEVDCLVISKNFST